MDDLSFSHQFESGRTITLMVKRHLETKPVVACSLHCSQMTDEELCEYEPWRNNTVARLMSILTPGEVFASNQGMRR